MEDKMEDNVDDEVEIEIDNTWVELYKQGEEKYNMFYPEPLNSLTIFFLYVDKTNTLVKRKKDTCLLTAKNMLCKNQLISLIKSNEIFANRLYKLETLLRYHIDLQPENIADFVHSTQFNNDMYISRFFKPFTLVNDIYFSDTISLFHDLTTLYILFKEAAPIKSARLTKKLRRLSPNHRRTRHSTQHITRHSTRHSTRHTAQHTA